MSTDQVADERSGLRTLSVSVSHYSQRKDVAGPALQCCCKNFWRQSSALLVPRLALAERRGGLQDLIVGNRREMQIFSMVVAPWADGAPIPN